MTVYATVSAFVGFRGDNVGLSAGEPWDDEHPFVKARPDLFTATPPGGEPPTEQAPAEQAPSAKPKPAPTATAKPARPRL